MAAITSAGSGNWSSTTPNAPWPSGTVPTTGDTVTIANGHTATIDQNITTGADTSTAAITVASGGKLQYLSSAAAGYTLTLSGNITNSGTIEFGTVADPIPSNRYLDILFTSASPSDGKYGFIRNTGSTTIIQGAAKTPFVRLNADASVNATSLTADSSPSGWQDNDVIVVAATTRTHTETEKGALNGAPSGTTLTVDGFAGSGGGLANAHLGSGTSNGSMRAEVINLTRNIKIRGLSTGMAYVTDETTATVNVDNVEHQYLGEVAAGKRGLEVKTTSGSSSHQSCSFYDCEDGGFYAAGSANNNWQFSNNVMYNCDYGKTSKTAQIEQTSGTAWEFSGNVLLLCYGTVNTRVVQLSDYGGVFTNNVGAGCEIGNGGVFSFEESGGLIGTFSGNIAHSNQGSGFRISSGEWRGTILNNKSFRNASYGLSVNERTLDGLVEGLEAWGNVDQNILLSSSANNMTFKACKLNSDSTFTTARGIFSNGSGAFRYYNCEIGGNIAHTSSTIFCQDTQYQKHYFIDGIAAETNKTDLQDGAGNNMTEIRFLKLGGSTTDHRTYTRQGTVFSETSVRHTASGLSWKMTPRSATRKLYVTGPTMQDAFRKAVKANETLTLSIWVRKDSSYNGNAPRLVLFGGALDGIPNNVVDSLSVGADTWEELTVTATPTEDGVVEFSVDCDGTAGSAYVDDITASQA